MESDGNVLDFTNMHTLSTTHTRLHPALHLGEERYYALVDYVNDRLPPMICILILMLHKQIVLKKI